MHTVRGRARKGLHVCVNKGGGGVNKGVRVALYILHRSHTHV